MVARWLVAYRDIGNERQHMERTWQDNAKEFAALDNGEGWPFAILVACSVEKGKAGGVNQHNQEDHVNRHDPRVKVSASGFAERAGTTAHRVLRYLTAWDAAAAADVVPPADTLSPGDAHDVPTPDVPFGTFYSAAEAGGRPRDSKAEDAVKIIEKRGAEAVIEAMTPSQRVEVASALIEAVPAEDVEHVRVAAERRQMFDREAEAMAAGAQPVDATKHTTPKSSPAEAIMGGLLEQRDVIDALESTVTYARLAVARLRVLGYLDSEHPSASRIQTLVIEAGDTLATLNDLVQKVMVRDA